MRTWTEGVGVAPEVLAARASCLLPDLARHDLVCLGAGVDDYRARQSIRMRALGSSPARMGCWTRPSDGYQKGDLAASGAHCRPGGLDRGRVLALLDELSVAAKPN